MVIRPWKVNLKAQNTALYTMPQEERRAFSLRKEPIARAAAPVGDQETNTDDRPYVGPTKYDSQHAQVRHLAIGTDWPVARVWTHTCSDKQGGLL
jgi:hypothetical protein